MAALSLALDGLALPMITDLVGWKGYLWATAKQGWGKSWLVVG
jgi:hypothetical protein